MMKAQLWMPRLNGRQVEELTVSLDRLNQIHDSVAATNIGGRLAVMQLCVETYRSIESVLRKVHAAVMSQQTRALALQALQGPEKEA
jgi:hypothetical protein